MQAATVHDNADPHSIPHQDPVTELSEAEALPWIDAKARLALNRLHARMPPQRLQARGIAYQLRWAWDQDGFAAPESYRFKIGPHSGMLGLDATTHAALLGERRAHLLPRELRYVLLAEALQPAADLMEKTLQLPFEWLPPQPDDAAAGAELHGAAHFRAAAVDGSQGPSLRGYVQFDDPGRLDALVPEGQPAEPPMAMKTWLAGLRVPVSFCLGTTQIRLRDVAGITRGDIIGLEEWGSSGTALLVTADVGGPHGCRLHGLADG